MENLGSRLCSTPVITTFSCPSLGIRLITPPHRRPTILCLLHLSRRLISCQITPCMFVHLPGFASVRACSTDKRYVCVIEYPTISLTSLPPSSLFSFSLSFSPYPQFRARHSCGLLSSLCLCFTAPSLLFHPPSCMYVFTSALPWCLSIMCLNKWLRRTIIVAQGFDSFPF
jgi:hypothetical protein